MYGGERRSTQFVLKFAEYIISVKDQQKDKGSLKINRDLMNYKHLLEEMKKI